jgi:hypothetical protein
MFKNDLKSEIKLFWNLKGEQVVCFMTTTECVRLGCTDITISELNINLLRANVANEISERMNEFERVLWLCEH